jgi:acyl-CoA synthetase (AMP-forming)/AMP-acid ligase II
VELGSTAGAGLQTDQGTRRADAPHRAMTEHILALADRAGNGAALIDAAAQGSGEACVTTWPKFARTVRAAARGLSRRGLREADTAAVLVQDAGSHVVAVHAVRAAGAIAAPIRPAQTAAGIAAQLKQDRARLLITSAPLAELAAAAAERSWVRQVFAFGEAEGTTPFASLLRSGTGDDGGASSGPGGSGPGGSGPGGAASSGPGGEAAAVQAMAAAGLGLDGPIPGLTCRDVVVAAPPCGDPDAYTWLLDLALAAGATIVAAPLPQVTAAVAAHNGTAAIVPCGTDVPGLPTERIFTVG